MRGVAAALILAMGANLAEPARADIRILSFDDLDGWEQDDHAAALNTFRETCDLIDGPDWASLCALASTVTDARGFFELFFRPVLAADSDPALFTGYYEPELPGSRVRTPRFAHPIYRRPPELADGMVWKTRSEIENHGLLHGRGLELVWLENPVDVFFLQVQGSGRVRLTDGTLLRVGYGGRNGHPYRSVGAELARRGILPAHRVSAGAIRNWVRGNPAEGRTMLQHNPSFIFFREVRGVDPTRGPLGAMSRSLTPLRSIAVDPDHVPLGAPVWLEKDGAGPMRRLMVAQDTGGAIRGAQRADIFFGTGDTAGDAAGTVRDSGRLVTLLPIELALQIGS